MKKFTPAIGLILIALLFTRCSNDNEENVDAALLAQVQGKWKLTAFHTDTPSGTTAVVNGPVMELKSDGTFTSDEENGYTGGSYTVIKTPGKNLRLIFEKEWAAKLVYKYINAVSNNTLSVQASSTEPLSDGMGFLDGYTWTRIP